MKEFKSSTGKKIVINCASMKNAKRLRKALANELLKVNIDVGNPKDLSELSNTFKDTNKWLNIFKEILLGLETSEDFDNVINDCMKECTYDNIKLKDLLYVDEKNICSKYKYIIQHKELVNMIIDNQSNYYNKLKEVVLEKIKKEGISL